jgi:YD repeat-containing protein
VSEDGHAAIILRRSRRSNSGRAKHLISYNKDDRLVADTDANGNTVTYTFDGVGNQIGVTDANNHGTSYAYDSMNRLTTVTDALGDTTVYGYDSGGNQVTQVDG